MYHRKHRLTVLSKRGLAVILALSMLLSFAPAVFAEGTDIIEEAITDVSPTETETSEEEAEEATAVEEIPELRDEFSKTFLMSDGSYTQVTYGSAVHYKDENGVFQEIDNRLSVNALTDRITNENGTGTLSFSQSAPGAAIDANGHDISWTVEKEGETVSPGMSQIMSYALSAMPTVTAGFTNTAETAEFKALSAEEQLMSAPKAFSEMRYTDIANGYGVVYSVAPGRVKEDIVVFSPDTSAYTVTFTARGLTASLGDYRSVIFTDVHGETVMTVEVPYMYDAAGETSTDIDISLARTTNGYILTVTPNADWMTDPARVYPVTVDPTYTSSQTSGITDTMVHTYDTYNGEGTCVCGVEHSTWHYMTVGTQFISSDAGYITSAGFIKIAQTGAVVGSVSDAKLRVYLMNAPATAGLKFDLYRIKNSWDANINENSTINLDSTPVDENVAVTASGSSYYCEFNITEYLNNMYAGFYKSNGFKLAGDSTNPDVYTYFCSSEYGTVASRPYVTFNYVLYAVSGTRYINNKSSYRFLRTGIDTANLTTGKYDVDANADNSVIKWNINNTSAYDGYCTIRPASDTAATYALCDPGTSSGRAVTAEYTSSYRPYAEDNYKWHIFEYSPGTYYIRNKATGRLLYSNGLSGTDIYAVTDADTSPSMQWRVMSMSEYNPRTNITEHIYNKSVGDTLSYNNIPKQQGTFSNDDNSYTYSLYAGGAVAFGTYSLTVTGYGVGKMVFTCKDTTATTTVYILSSEFPGTYFVKNVQSDLCLDVEVGGDKAMQQNYDQSSPPVWQIELQTDGYYTIKDVESGRFLKVSGDSSAENQVIKVYDSTATSAGYRFKIFTTADGFYKIVPKTNPNLTLAISATNTSAGNVIRQVTYTQNDDHKDEWRVIPNIYGTQDFRQLDEDDYTKINCHGYAMMRNDIPEGWLPATHMTVNGYFTSGSDYEQHTGIVALSTQQEFESWLKKEYGTEYYDYEGVITNNFNYTPLMHNQYRVILRIGLGIVNKENKFDYHFWYQTYDGRWANKHGFKEDSEPELLGYDVTPCTENTDGWAMGDAYPNFYDSSIYSYIITIPESEVE